MSSSFSVRRRSPSTGVFGTPSSTKSIHISIPLAPSGSATASISEFDGSQSLTENHRISNHRTRNRHQTLASPHRQGWKRTLERACEYPVSMLLLSVFEQSYCVSVREPSCAIIVHVSETTNRQDRTMYIAHFETNVYS